MDEPGKSLTLKNRNKRSTHNLLRLNRQGSTTIKYIAQSVTSLDFDLAKYDRIGDVAQDGHVSLLDGHAAPEDTLLQRGHLVDIVEDALADCLPDLRDTDHDRWLALLEIALAVAH